MDMKHLVICLICIVCNILRVHSYINGITPFNIKSYTETNKFLMVFITSADCMRCRNLYKNFVAVSQPFHGDRDIYFGKTSNLQLIKEWKIEELPAIIYFRMGSSKAEFFEGEFTVDNIFDTVAYVMGGDFSGLERVYHVEINEENYEQLIIKPKQHAILLIYDLYHEEQMVAMKGIAKMYKEDDDVVIAVLDADKNRAFRDTKFNFPGAPLLYWFPIDDKFGIKRFGGDLTTVVIQGFINEQTHSWRNKDGTLMMKAGRYDVIDNIIEGSLGGILHFDQELLIKIIEEVENEVEKLNSNDQEFGRYYLFILQNIKDSKDTVFLRDEQDKIFNEMEDLDLFNRKRDTLIRKHHILDFYIMKIADFIIKNPNYKDEIKKTVTTDSNKSKVPDHHEL